MADRDNKCAVACAEQLRNQVIDVRLVFAYIAMLTRADVLDYANHQRPLFIVRKASNLLRNTVAKEPEISALQIDNSLAARVYYATGTVISAVSARNPGWS